MHWVILLIKSSATLIVVCLICLPSAIARKPDNPGGGNGGGEQEPAATIITLSDSTGYVHDLTDVEDGLAAAVGTVELEGGERVPMHWWIDASGAVLPTILPSLVEGGETVPREINDHGQIVGQETLLEPLSIRPLLWASALEAAPMELPIPEGRHAWATGINNDGLVVGQLFDELGSDVIAWKVGEVEGETVVLDTLILDVGDANVPFISGDGGFVAYTADVGEGDRAFRLEIGWDGTELFEIANSRVQLFDVYSIAHAVNSVGTVAGRSNDAGGPDNAAGGRGAYAMTISGELLELPGLPGGRRRGVAYEWLNTHAAAINDDNVVVNWAVKSGTAWMERTDVLAVPGGKAVDLREYAAGWVGHSTLEINNQGWISGRILDGGRELPVILIVP